MAMDGIYWNITTSSGLGQPIVKSPAFRPIKMAKKCDLEKIVEMQILSVEAAEFYRTIPTITEELLPSNVLLIDDDENENGPENDDEEAREEENGDVVMQMLMTMRM